MAIDACTSFFAEKASSSITRRSIASTVRKAFK